MRLAMVVIAIAAMAVTLVRIRREELNVQHDIQRLHAERISLRRGLADARVRVGRLTSPQTVRAAARRLALPLHAPGDELAMPGEAICADEAPGR